MKLDLESWASAQEAGHEGLPPTAASPGRFQPPPIDELQGRIANLEIRQLIGSGGMGAVYKARQMHLDRTVALKLINPAVADDPGFAERFAREAKTLARLSHPHIVTVHDFGQMKPLPEGEDGERSEPGEGDGQLYYFIMEYVDGTNLRELIRHGKLQPEEALAIVPQICDALQYAHDQGVVHRDIKPENILLDRQGGVKIADFGLAKIAGRAPAGEAATVGKAWTLTETGRVMGTLHYVAPEQMRGSHAVDHRADIYSLGVVFYEMLTGELSVGRFEPPSRKVQVDVRLDEVVLRALESNPEQRHQKASDVKTDVETISSQSQIAAADSPSVAPPTAEDPRTVESARQQVRVPAIGLIVAGGSTLIMGLIGIITVVIPNAVLGSLGPMERAIILSIALWSTDGPVPYCRRRPHASPRMLRVRHGCRDSCSHPPHGTALSSQPALGHLGAGPPHPLRGESRLCPGESRKDATSNEQPGFRFECWPRG